MPRVGSGSGAGIIIYVINSISGKQFFLAKEDILNHPCEIVRKRSFPKRKKLIAFGCKISIIPNYEIYQLEHESA